MFGSRAVQGKIPFEIWGQRGWHNVDVVGEQYRSAAAIKGLFADGTGGMQWEGQVQLRPEPENKHDRNAIAIYCDGVHVGYLPRELAVEYAQVLAAIDQAGYVACTPGTIWAFTFDREFDCNCRLELPPPHMLVPINSPPIGPVVELPMGSVIQVQGEENHLGTLRAWTRPEGEAWVYVTLASFVQATARAQKTLVEVRIDGQPVGQLTPKMSSELLPAIDLLAEHGLQAAARATVTANAIKAEVKLYTLRAHELPGAWIDGVTGGQGVAGAESPQPRPADGPASDVVVVDDVVVEQLPPPSLPPAGWYPDPRHEARVRWWDGAVWTEHTAS